MPKFRRSNPAPVGAAYVMIETLSNQSVRHIKIEGRDIYETQDEHEIEILRKDPEIEEVKEKKEKKEK